jgi:hypothetical protein
MVPHELWQEVVEVAEEVGSLVPGNPTIIIQEPLGPHKVPPDKEKTVVTVLVVAEVVVAKTVEPAVVQPVVTMVQFLEKTAIV